MSDTDMQSSRETGESDIPEARPREINVGSGERKISLVGGTILALMGVRRGGLRGLAMAATGGMLAYRGISGYCPAMAALGLNRASDQAPAEPEQYFSHGIHVEESLTINRSPEELFGIWRDFTNLPRFMSHLQSVEVLDNNRSRWVAKAPIGWSVQWEAEIINEEPNALIAWQSVGGVDVDNAGSVRFLPAGEQGTEVRVALDYIPPAGKFGFMLAKVFGEDAEQQIKQDLRRFKQLVESGEMAQGESQTAKESARKVPVM